MYEQFGISKDLENLANKVEGQIKEQFAEIDKTCEKNSLKVLKAFQKNNLSEVHFNTSTGYGIDEPGRNKVEEIYAEIFKAEDALVRAQLISGTHALWITLSALLKPGDTMLSISGLPYDTLQTVIGVNSNPSQSSLKAYGVKYEQIDLVDNDFNINAILERLQMGNVKLIEIQKSIGYSTRKALKIEQIEKTIKEIRNVDHDVIIMVDNCYGEFVEDREPIEVGADIAVGSLMKNLGAGIVTTGAYIVGKKDLINLCAERLTAPGVAKEIGPSLGQNINFLKGLFFAPSVVANSLKTAVFASKLLQDLGYSTSPNFDEKRGDIVQTITFNDEQKLIDFCQGIQKGSPIDSFVKPVPSDMGGYDDKIIMAAGTFTEGSTIELSCDGPIRKPYMAYLQGGLTYQYGKIGVLKAIQNVI